MVDSDAVVESCTVFILPSCMILFLGITSFKVMLLFSAMTSFCYISNYDIIPKFRLHCTVFPVCRCVYLHGLVCDTCGRQCLHPFDDEQQKSENLFKVYCSCIPAGIQNGYSCLCV